MSGPYRCTMCGGCGRVERDCDDGPLVKCTECNGTGERWPESNAPSLEMIGALMRAGVPVDHLPATKADAIRLFGEIAADDDRTDLEPWDD